MGNQEAKSRNAYVKALLEEAELEIRRRTLAQVQVIMRSMQHQEKEAYLESKAFRNAMNQTRKKDRLWQQLSAGTIPDEREAEFERLQPLIMAELRAGAPPDLGFLRSVQRSRIPLRTAREARDLLARGKAREWLTQHAGRLVQELDALTVDWLVTFPADLLLRKDHGRLAIPDALLQAGFQKGITQQHLEKAVPEGGLDRFLTQKLFDAWPCLRICANVRLDRTHTVADRTREEAHRAAATIAAKVGARFSRKRIRGLLIRNASVKALEARAEADRKAGQRLKEALLQAMPEEIRDLWPLARRMHRRFVLHFGPTNSGKTWESIQRLHTAQNGVYLGPLRLLAVEQFETMNVEDVPCSLITGEERILVPGSRVQSSTIEMADLHAHYDIAVIDECQMITDRDRGGAWTAAVLGLCADEIHICASPEAEQLLCGIISSCGDELSIVRHERMCPLEVEKSGFRFPESVRPGDALIVFSKARVHALAAELRQMGRKVSLIYGALPPDVRRNQAERFRQGETDIVVSTDAIAMGMNLPISRVVFMEGEKFDGDIVRSLTDTEIRQIAGRAGRYGQYDIGYVNALGFRTVIAQALTRPALPLTQAVVQFPESLLGLPLSLTETIDRWIAMKDRPGFTKASIMRMQGLAARMETRSTDKRLLYSFLCIPFDETEQTLLDDWKAMYRAECLGTHWDVRSALPGLMDPESCTVTMLDRLERDYRRCDLYYNYARRFLDTPDRLLEEIQMRKDLISSGIIHILSTQKLQGRRCSRCGRALQWNWPWPVCDSCYRRHAPFSEDLWDE